MMADTFTRYVQLCGQLDRLRLDFEKLGNEQQGLFCGKFDTGVLDECGFQERLSGWKEFAKGAEGKVGNGKWEHWDIWLSGSCVCYFGNSDLFTHFHRLAESGLLILSEFGRLEQLGAVMPPDFSLKMPGFVGNDNWIELVFETAQLNTPFLRFAENSHWDFDEIGPNWEDLTDEDFWDTTSEGVRFPRYPQYQTLHHDLCSSSAEAIRLWRNPNEVVRDLELYSEYEAPTCLPNPESVIVVTLRPASTIQNAMKPRLEGYELRGKSGEIIKSYAESATSQIQILRAFQEAGWPTTHPDPCGIKQRAKEVEANRINAKSQLVLAKTRRRETVRNLRDGQNEIVFLCAERGFGVSWHWKSDSTHDTPTTNDAEIQQGG